MQIQVAPYSLYNNNHFKVQNKKIAFQGHCDYEIVSRALRKALIHETAFFREPQSLEFVKKYIRHNFPSTHQIKILDGACSTGEETWTLAMLLKNRNVDITGFDASQKTIDKAKNLKYKISFSKYKDKFPNCQFQDTYLAFKDKNNLTQKETFYKNLFQEFFEPAKAQKNRNSFFDFLSTILLLPEKARRYRVRPEKASLCKFVKEDIFNLNSLAKDNEVDVLLFRNALYHLTTDDMYYRVAKPDSAVEETLTPIFKNIHNKLSPNGIFVIGEQESEQATNAMLIPKLLKKNNFTPIYSVNQDFPCIWKKI